MPADDVGRFLDAATEVTGDELTMNGVSFSVEDPAPLLAPLRELAVADAQAKARVLAAATDCELGPVVSIVEGGGGGPTPVFKAGAGLRMAMAAPIEAGTELLTLQVTVTYELGALRPGRREGTRGEEVGWAGGDGWQQAVRPGAGPG